MTFYQLVFIFIEKHRISYNCKWIWGPKKKRSNERGV